MNLAEGKILLGPELMVPVLGLLPQVSESFFQLRFILWDVVHDWTQVGIRVWWTDPVMSGTGHRPDSRSLEINNKQQKYLVKGAADQTNPKLLLLWHY